jgi:hypothetical protein
MDFANSVTPKKAGRKTLILKAYFDHNSAQWAYCSILWDKLGSPA